MTHGGNRKGAGRPALAPEDKKMAVSYKLPKYIVDWIRVQPESATFLLEKALTKTYKIKP